MLFKIFTAVSMMNAVFWAVVRTEVSEERSASIIWVTRICELGTTLAIASNQCTQRSFASYCYSSYFHLDDGDATFLRNVGSHKSHTAYHPRIRHSCLQLCPHFVLIAFAYGSHCYHQPRKRPPSCSEGHLPLRQILVYPQSL
jgi:hypothetical protein